MRLVLGLISIIAAAGLLFGQGFSLRNVAFLPSATTVEAAASSPTPDIVWWKLNDGSGTDITGDSTNGGDDGATTADWATGKSGSGYSLNFNGSADSAITDSTITFATNKVTLTCWVWFDATNTQSMIAESGSTFDQDGKWWLWIDTDGRVHTTITHTGYRVESFQAPDTGAWHHYAVIFDNSTAGGEITCYFDGDLQTMTLDTDTKAGTDVFSQLYVYVGARNEGSLYLDGKVDDLRIYSGALSEVQIEAIIADPQ